jgi:hypothetical protein
MWGGSSERKTFGGTGAFLKKLLLAFCRVYCLPIGVIVIITYHQKELCSFSLTIECRGMKKAHNL